MKKLSKLIIGFIIFVQLLSTMIFADEKEITVENSYEKLDIDSNAAILIEENSGKIIYEKNSREKMYPASTTKILTAILVLENCNLDDIVTVNESALKAIPEGYVIGNLLPGEELSVNDLMYALLLKSANDVAVVLAEHVSGSVQEFSKLMNKKAKEIGCNNSNFVNPNGIHDEEHYTTAYDMALIAKYCMKNEEFKKFIKTEEYILPKTNKYSRADRKFENTNALILQNSSYYYKYATGIKTGYTKEARNCLVSSASKDDVNFISVVLDGGKTSDGRNSRFVDTEKIFEYGFDNYSYRTIKNKGNVVENIVIENATKETKNLEMVLEDSIVCFCNNELDFENIQPEIKLKENLKAPIFKDMELGSATYTIDGEKYTVKLLAKSEVLVDKCYILMIAIGISCFIIGFIIIIRMKSKNKKYRKNRK